MFAFNIPYLESIRAIPGGDPAAFAALLIIFAIAFQLILKTLLLIAKALVGRTKTTLDDRLLGAVDKYLPWIAMTVSLWIALGAIYPDITLLDRFSETDVFVIILLAVLGLMLSAVADALLLWYGLELRPGARKVRDDEAFPFVRNIVKITIVAIFIVFILQRMGFDTTAIITGLGVGGLAVALALQDTLGNFFAGVHILVDKPFREADYIKLENGTEGTVKQIGWRTTRLVTLAQNEIVVPNSKLANSITENFSTPREMSGVLYEIGVDYREDIDMVEKIITDVLHGVAVKFPIMDASTIWVRFDSFGDFSLNFKFGFLVQGYVNRFGVQKEIFRQLFYEFRKNDVNIPFPARVVYSPPPARGAPEKEAKKK